MRGGGVVPPRREWCKHITAHAAADSADAWVAEAETLSE